MVEEIFRNTEIYNKSNNAEHKKAQGQFFTSLRTANFMGSHFVPANRNVKILDPGAGNGGLTAATVESLIDRGLCDEISITFVENDVSVIPLLKDSAHLIQNYCINNGVVCNIDIFDTNFILSDIRNRYDLIICNPPYKKIRKDSIESHHMSKYVHGQPNIYALFMAKGLELLNGGGTYIYITPRSWTSGAYFTKVRQAILNGLSIDKIHIFDSRDDSFSDEKVLQETMILFGKKISQVQQVEISVCENDLFEDVHSFNITADCIKNVGEDHYLLIPENNEEANLISDMRALPETFLSLGYIFKTGPVVEFRNRDYISNRLKDDYVPMYRALNIKDDSFTFPVKADKAQYISKNAHHLLMRNEDTVLVKRLSAKEERRRIQSCIYYRQGDAQFMSIENHVNYAARTDGAPLTREEVEWIHSILSSDEYDSFFRILNGSTQVNANELNMLPVRRISL